MTGNGNELPWNPWQMEHLDTGGRALSSESADIIRDVMHQLITEAQLMLVWGVGLINSRDTIRNDLDESIRSFFQCPSPATVQHADVAVSPEVDRILKINIRVPPSRVTEAFRLRGDVERLFARAFVVFIYHLWDESTRPIIANTLRVPKKNSVKADLMGDWKHLRNWIVHPNQGTENDYFSRSTIFIRELHLQHERQPAITMSSVMTMIDLLGAMQIRVDDNQ